MPEIEAPPSRPRKVLLVLAVSAGVLSVVAVCVVLLAVKLGEAAGRARVANEKVRCAGNLKALAGILIERRLSRARGDAPAGGTGTTAGVRGDAGELNSPFECPADAGSGEESSSETNEVNPGVCLQVPGGGFGLFRTSFRIRQSASNGRPGDSHGKSPLAACFHHPDGVNVLYDDSSVVFLDRAALGLAPEDPIETGPAAKSEVLRFFHPARDR